MSSASTARLAGSIAARDFTAGVDDAFVELPRRVYAADPAWIPEDEDSLRRAFSLGNPWFARGRAVTLCVRGRARLAVFREPGCRVRGRESAFFGYWEHRGAADASLALLDAAAEWARTHGAETLYGPVNFTTLGTYRLRLSAEPGAVTFPGEPYNPPGYPALLEGAGFAPVQHYVTQVGMPGGSALAPAMSARRALLDAGYTIEPLDGARWLAMLPELHRAADAIFGANLAYTPVSFEAFAAGYGATVARRLCPRTSLVARAPDGALAGFLLVYPHYGPLLVRGAPGGRVPVGALSYDEHAPALERLGERTAVAKTVGVVAAHQGRGLMSALGVTALERGRAHYDRWLAALIRADNPSRRFGAAHMRAERTYALYARPLDGPRDGGSDARNR